MRFKSIATTIAAGALSLASVGCASSIEVRTMAAPRVTLTEFQTFRLLPMPPRRDGLASAGSYDPMVNNSITNRALRESVVRAFQDRGYVLMEPRADIAVAVYASAREKLDLSMWEYGYPYWPHWWRSGMPQQTIIQYTEGTVVIDVIDPFSRELIWRGSGVATLEDDPAQNTKQLQKVAAAIIAKFPPASTRRVAANR